MHFEKDGVERIHNLDLPAGRQVLDLSNIQLKYDRNKLKYFELFLAI
jgi:hypothetical protein